MIFQPFKGIIISILAPVIWKASTNMSHMSSFLSILILQKKKKKTEPAPQLVKLKRLFRNSKWLGRSGDCWWFMTLW